MIIGPRYHLNHAARDLVDTLIERAPDYGTPFYESAAGHLIYRTRVVAERESDSPLFEREVIVELVDEQTGETVSQSVWSEEETRAHRDALKDEEVAAMLPYPDPDVLAGE